MECCLCKRQDHESCKGKKIKFYGFPRSSINTYKKWLSVCNTTEEEEKRNNLKVCNFCFDPVAFQSAYEISLRSTAIPRKCLENLVDKCRLCFTEGSKANPVLRVENAFLERELTGIEFPSSERLSKVVCLKCRVTIVQFKEFKRKTLVNQNFLSDALREMNENIQKPTEPVEEPMQMVEYDENTALEVFEDDYQTQFELIKDENEEHHEEVVEIIEVEEDAAPTIDIKLDEVSSHESIYEIDPENQKTDLGVLESIKFPCQQCPRVFQTKKLLNIHINCVHQKFICDIFDCSQHFISKYFLIRHKYEKHGVPLPLDITVRSNFKIFSK